MIDLCCKGLNSDVHLIDAMSVIRSTLRFVLSVLVQAYPFQGADCRSHMNPPCRLRCNGEILRRTMLLHLTGNLADGTSVIARAKYPQRSRLLLKTGVLAFKLGDTLVI